MKQRKSGSKKPRPEMLGTGLAAKAGKKLQNRKRAVDSYVDSVTNQTGLRAKY